MLIRQVDSLEDENRLDKLLHAVYCIGFEVIDLIEDRQNEFKCSHSRFVRRIFDDRDAAQGVRLPFRQLVFYDLKVVIGGITAIEDGVVGEFY